MSAPSIPYIRIASIACALVVLAAPARATDFTWDGNGDLDSGGSWTNPLNWDLDSGYPDDTNDTATLPYPTGTRIVTVDVATTIDQLAIADGAFNIVKLDANLEVRLVDHPSDDGSPPSEIDLNGNILTVNSGTAAYFPNIDGAGELVKIGAGQVTLNGEADYTGSFIVSNGTLKFRCGDFTTASKLSVLDGGTAQIEGV